MPAPRNSRHFVYIAECSNGLIKIGRTAHLPSRMRALTSFAKCEVTLRGFHECRSFYEACELEAAFHRFAHSMPENSRRGEWHQFDPYLVDFFFSEFGEGVKCLGMSA